MGYQLTESEEKLANLILHVLKQCENDKDFNFEELCYILYKSDFTNYAETGKSITGVQYVAALHGPEPECIGVVLEHLAATGSIILDERFYV